MRDISKAVGSWVDFAGFVLVVAVLYWAQGVIVPIALAVLITFLLAPAVTWLQRWTGRVPAVLILALLLFSLVGGAIWGLGREFSGLANELPNYRANIRQKISDIRLVGKGGSVEKVQETLNDIQKDLARDDKAPNAPQPVVVAPPALSDTSWLPAWLAPLAAPLATAALVIVLVIFMLLEREDLRNRFIRVIGHGHLTVTTRAFDEAATRVSRYLLMQSLINLTFGTGVAVGLFFVGVPYAPLWGALGAALRFIPYVGPWVAAAGPILVSLAALPGWLRPLEVVAIFVALELIASLALEPILYAGAAGVSQVALLVAVAFWTWLWGPLGLLMATPLTVCLVVLGRHVSGLDFLTTLMADSPALPADVRFYQRLLARDQSEAADLIEECAKSDQPDRVYDTLLLPALNYAERDRFAGQLSGDEERAIIDAARELVDDATRQLPTERADDDPLNAAAGGTAVHVFAWPAASEADELALRMLSALVRNRGITIDIVAMGALTAEIIEAVRNGGYRVVCIADLPPSPPSKTRYVIKKIRAALPEVKILVGRWATPGLADDTEQPLIDAGANHVASTLLATRDQLLDIAASQPRVAADVVLEQTA